MRYKIKRFEDFLDVPEEKIEDALDNVMKAILLWYTMAKNAQKNIFDCEGVAISNEKMKFTCPAIEYCDDGKKEIKICEDKEVI